jgi:hypothetical protein
MLDAIGNLFRRFAAGINYVGKAFDRCGIDLYELRDGKFSLKDSYLKAD